MIADYHLHSSFSGDSNTPSEAAVLSALDKGLSLMCFTEHFDPDYPYQDVSMELDVPAYFTELRRLQSLYADRIGICIGAELGLQPHLGDYLRSWLSRCLADGYAFDFLIGSTHLVDRTDPYYPQFWSCRRTEEAVSRYLEVTLENIQAFDDFDVYGHLDYIIRYAPEDERRFSYSAHEEQIDTILRLLIQKGKGIEINTAGYKSGFWRAKSLPCRSKALPGAWRRDYHHRSRRPHARISGLSLWRSQRTAEGVRLPVFHSLSGKKGGICKAVKAFYRIVPPPST